MEMNDWTKDLPTEPGSYWFYGNPFLGQMGQDFAGSKVADQRLILVKIKRTGNNVLVGVGDGHFIYLTRFDPASKRSGLRGYWKPENLPALPTDDSEFQL